LSYSNLERRGHATPQGTTQEVPVRNAKGTGKNMGFYGVFHGEEWQGKVSRFGTG
jgi:hypothetical protein